jgi:hypothetical protein
VLSGVGLEQEDFGNTRAHGTRSCHCSLELVIKQFCGSVSPKLVISPPGLLQKCPGPTQLKRQTKQKMQVYASLLKKTNTTKGCEIRWIAPCRGLNVTKKLPKATKALRMKDLELKQTNAYLGFGFLFLSSS